MSGLKALPDWIVPKPPPGRKRFAFKKRPKAAASNAASAAEGGAGAPGGDAAQQQPEQQQHEQAQHEAPADFEVAVGRGECGGEAGGRSGGGEVERPFEVGGRCAIRCSGASLGAAAVNSASSHSLVGEQVLRRRLVPGRGRGL